MFARIAFRIARTPLIRAPFCWPIAPIVATPVMWMGHAHRRPVRYARPAQRARRSVERNSSLLETALRRLAESYAEVNKGHA